MAKEPFCKNCLLYDFNKRHCKVVILYEGERINPPTEPEDRCLFEQEYDVINEENGKTEKWKPEVQQVRWWVEDKLTGQPSAEGVVKIEYPEGFLPE